jgi:hypothetical protein
MMTEFAARDLHLAKKALAIAVLAIERRSGPLRSSSDQADMKALLDRLIASDTELENYARSARIAISPEPRTAKGDRASTLDPRAWSTSTPQEREAFVKEVGLRDIENVINAMDPIFALTRGCTLMQAWNAAAPPERLAFAREYHDAIKTLGWQQKWR